MSEGINLRYKSADELREEVVRLVTEQVLLKDKIKRLCEYTEHYNDCRIHWARESCTCGLDELTEESD